MKLWPRVWCLVFFDSRCSVVVVVVIVVFEIVLAEFVLNYKFNRFSA